MFVCQQKKKKGGKGVKFGAEKFEKEAQTRTLKNRLKQEGKKEKMNAEIKEKHL